MPKVSYFYDPEIGNFHYGPGHPMKPHRIRMAHSLVVNYGLNRKMDIFRPIKFPSDVEFTKFHANEYIDFLRSVSPENMSEFTDQLVRFNVGEDCPVFDGVYDFCQLYSAGSVSAAIKLNHHQADIAINWSGGLHHAKRHEASGFCYVNDCVLAILELLKFHQRVLYIDIDIHHGDGVEEAFYSSNRVMTCSFHKFGDYFPSTGWIDDVGVGAGAGYAVNFPLQDGMDDEALLSIYKPVIAKIMETFQPGAVVLQCGADSLSGDRLGCFNLSIKGHGECVDYIKRFNVPLLVLGGGGYTIRNVSRCWAYETGLLLNTELPDEIPYNDYYEYYCPDYRLHIQTSNMENLNSKKDLDNLKIRIFDNLKQVSPVGVRISNYGPQTPSDIQLDQPEPNPDVRESEKKAEITRAMKAEEFYEGEDDNDRDNPLPYAPQENLEADEGELGSDMSHQAAEQDHTQHTQQTTQQQTPTQLQQEQQQQEQEQEQQQQSEGEVQHQEEQAEMQQSTSMDLS
eukprot:GILK01002493.1.p1 GENE.GILK01002493.1~~GILK01002493.1.p1  ORF type:complete len:511 (-),score=109.41 GILK01002493.1:171-1703(-)